MKYVPCLKSSVSEFRALSHLTMESSTVPLIELTKGRKTHEKDQGEIRTCFKKIKECLEKRKFFVDITSDETNINDELRSFKQQSSGFINWVAFVTELGAETNTTPIPIIQATNSDSIHQIDAQILMFKMFFEHIAIRIGASGYSSFKTKGYDKFLRSLIDISVKHDVFIYFLVDAETIRTKSGRDLTPTKISQAKLLIEDILSALDELDYENYKIISLASSYPSSINQEHGGDSEGEALLFDWTYYSELKETISGTKLIYGDYACINAEQKPTNAYNWVPRIDFPTRTLEICKYTRYRTDEVNGYTKCAQRLMNKHIKREDRVDCWGFKQIEATAKESEPTGKSPSFWISVRANIWMTRIQNQLKT
ncbi:hypothetical protein CWE15_04390 [Aliidiomarina taiwanensis]|uniref:Beta family protein n=1 Tax=Aliidiomarina taiwanensis TaxID=946228 RepID=A0A432X784_9GAMM|nr:hypothetical protein [Aliidiomarina taiwanensis]RUO42657.1 hypothetical protein CWE15_04390 [Aliidiomarina taiwanensis]